MNMGLTGFPTPAEEGMKAALRNGKPRYVTFLFRKGVAGGCVSMEGFAKRTEPYADDDDSEEGFIEFESVQPPGALFVNMENFVGAGSWVQPPWRRSCCASGKVKDKPAVRIRRAPAQPGRFFRPGGMRGGWRFARSEARMNP
jgi:hypothetical protein